MTIELEKLMRPDEMQSIGVEKMTANQRRSLAEWGMRVFMLGQHVVANIEEIKYDGRLIILDDGSRWEVDSSDAFTAEMWSELDRVVVIGDEMYLLDELEKVAVELEP